MENIQIISTGSYLPKQKVTNATLAEKLGITEEYIVKRTGILERYYSKEETIVDLAVYAAKDALKKVKENIKIDEIIVATTSSKELMPSISFQVKRKIAEVTTRECICQDILSGCAGYINALDIARNTIVASEGRVKTALVIGVEKLSEFLEETDIGTSIILSDGAGATIIAKTEEKKEYKSYFTVDAEEGDMLTCKANGKIHMDGKAVYKYAVTKTVENVENLLTKQELQQIDTLVLHQSNKKIMQSIGNRLQIPEEKIFTNIHLKGNTFCASIPIALDDMQKQGKLQKNNTILMLGYGGGMNTASIYLQV